MKVRMLQLEVTLRMSEWKCALLETTSFSLNGSPRESDESAVFTVSVYLFSTGIHL